MTQRTRAFDDLANLLANAAGAVKGLGDEAKAVGRARAEKMIADLDLVTRDEFEVLKARLDAMSAELSELKGSTKAKKASPKSANRSAAKKPTAKRASKAKKPATKKTTAKKTTTRKNGKA
jgi:BMFP domain-containing protein YqiC